ncbi:MAG: quinolinate synthase NadA [candidate division KSB1 bacterium]|nr:quinolinate synthase NadA [candidate division KSB1 bacterium]
MATRGDVASPLFIRGSEKRRAGDPLPRSQRPTLVPDEYLAMSDEEARQRVLAVKRKLGKELVILGHHYQRPEIVALADYRGDSFGLSKLAAQSEARYIVFCGVHFMAESADILSREDQVVLHPNLEAGCPLADFAPLELVEPVWDYLGRVLGEGRVMPVTYMNSYAELKAFVGRNGGTVCTSSNAHRAFQWALEQREKLFFFPDQYLGRNTLKRLGRGNLQVVVWPSQQPDAAVPEEQVRSADVFLWDGFCHVHRWFRPEHVDRVRELDPQAIVLVHPECQEEVVARADHVGSTEFIARYVASAPDGAHIAIGTEINMVRRLAMEHPTKRIYPLARSMCPNMFKITLQSLAWTLENLGEVNVVKVPEPTRSQARAALDRMLELEA